MPVACVLLGRHAPQTAVRRLAAVRSRASTPLFARPGRARTAVARVAAGGAAARRRASTASAAVPDWPAPSTSLTTYLKETASVPAPPRLDALVRLLAAQGLAPADPAARAGLHPLVVPLACGPSAAAAGLTGWAPASPAAAAASPAPADDPLPGSPAHGSSMVVVGLLRWAAPPDAAAGRGLPVVLTAVGSPRLTLLARSAEEYVHRALAEEDARTAGAGTGPLAAAVGPEESPYQPGDVPAGTPLGSPAFDAHLVRRVGAFPDVAERLIARHLAKPDTMSALITGEWYMRKGAFPGWARPYEAVARVYASLGRAEEARDCARAALALPWWGLEHGFAAAAALAELPPTPAGVRDALAAAERGAGGATAVPVSARTDAQVAMEAAAAAFDDVAGSGGEVVDWSAAVEPAAEALDRAGLADVAEFVRAATRAG